MFNELGTVRLLGKTKWVTFKHEDDSQFCVEFVNSASTHGILNLLNATIKFKKQFELWISHLIWSSGFTVRMRESKINL